MRPEFRSQGSPETFDRFAGRTGPSDVGGGFAGRTGGDRQNYTGTLLRHAPRDRPGGQKL